MAQTTSGAAPHSVVVQGYNAPATIAAAGASCVRAPITGTVTAVTYTPNAAVTGAATHFRTLTLINKGAAGSGSTSVAAKAQSSAGASLVAFDENAITLSGTPANLAVTAGDVLALVGTTSGDGLADPGGTFSVSISRD